MKKICALTSFFVLIICLFLLHSCDKKHIEKDGLIFEKYTLVDINGNRTEGYKLTGCDENAEIVDIPAYIKDLPVYSIEYNAFENCKNIKEIVIPETVIFFNHALAKCVNIEKLTTPISDMYKLFANATPQKLKYIYLTDKCVKIDTGDFKNFTSLLEVHIPKSVKTVEDGTNYTYIGVNGHTPPSKIDNLPFLGCNPELKIYCEETSKPSGWGEYWNYISENQKLSVFWGEYKSDIN